MARPIASINQSLFDLAYGHGSRAVSETLVRECELMMVMEAFDRTGVMVTLPRHCATPTELAVVLNQPVYVMRCIEKYGNAQDAYDFFMEARLRTRMYVETHRSVLHAIIKMGGRLDSYLKEHPDLSEDDRSFIESMDQVRARVIT